MYVHQITHFTNLLYIIVYFTIFTFSLNWEFPLEFNEFWLNCLFKLINLENNVQVRVLYCIHT